MEATSGSGPCNPIKIKREPVDDLTVVIKTEPEWESEENSSGLAEYTNNASSDMWEETQVYPLVKVEPAEDASIECVGVKNEAQSDPLDMCGTDLKREPTEHILKKEELLNYPDCSRPLQVLGEEEGEKNPDNDSKKNVLINIVPFLKQELDCNLHSIHKGRSSPVTGDGYSESVPAVDDSEDFADNLPESPRLVIAEAEDTSSEDAADELSVPPSLLGDGWRMTVFRCGHCMALAWDVFRLARHDCNLLEQRKLNSRILGRLRHGTQVKYINTFGCQLCGRLFFKRKNYRKHMSTMHSETMMQPYLKCKAYSEGDGCDPSVFETPERSVTAQVRSDTCPVNSCETDPKFAHDSIETAVERVGSSESAKICVVCNKDSCQMHKYALIRGRFDVTEKTSPFTCRQCVREFRCEGNYWRHMYYHGFKTENVLEEELTTVSQADCLVSAKKTRRPQKKSGSLQVELSTDGFCENVSPQLAASSLADLCSSKSCSQREGTGGVGTSTPSTDVCFALPDECEIHNPSSTADRSASKNKRRVSLLSLTAEEEEGPEPKKKRCGLPAVEHFSPADDCVTFETEVAPGCSSPQHSSESFRPRSSPIEDICGIVGNSEEREEECATEGQISEVALDGFCSERLEKNESSTRGAVNEKGEEVITEKPSEEHNGSCSTICDNFSAVTSVVEMCRSSSPQLRKGMNQSAVEVINISDDDYDDGDEDDNFFTVTNTGEMNSSPSQQLSKGMNQSEVEVINVDDDDCDDANNDNGMSDKTSSFPESDPLEIEEKANDETAAVYRQEEVERGSDYSTETSEQGHCQPVKTYTTLQNMEVDFSTKEREVGSANGDATGERSPLTAGTVTVGSLQPVGIPFVRAGVSYGNRVAVLKCVNSDNSGSRMGHPIGCDGRTGVKVLQVSNTSVYQTVPVPQVTNLTLVPTVKISENSGGTVRNLGTLSKLSLNVSAIPQTGACLLKCEKCGVLGTYGPTFFSHRCSPPNSSIKKVNKMVFLNCSRVATNGAAGVISVNSGGVNRQIRPWEAATRPVVWKCLRCKFTSCRSDVFKAHSCEPVVHVKILPDRQTAGGGMRCDVNVLPGARMNREAYVSLGNGTRGDPDLLPGAGMVCNKDTSPGAGTGCDRELSLGAGTRHNADVSPGAGTRRNADVLPGARTRQDAVVSPGAGRSHRADGSPGARTRQGTNVLPGARKSHNADMSRGARKRHSANVSSGARTRHGAEVSPGARTRRDTDVSLSAETRRDAGYLWKCVGCSLYSNSRQCLLMHKCSSFKRKATSSNALFTSGPELMCCKCGFKTAGRLMFATHQCAVYDHMAWVSRDKEIMKRNALNAPCGTSAKGE